MHIKRSLVLLILTISFTFVSSSSAQTLRFDPDPYFPADEKFTLPLLLEAGGLEVKGVECIITFDSALVSLESITPGPWYSESGQELFFGDYTEPGTSVLHFASAMLDSTNNTDGAIALCHFSFVDCGFCDLIFTEANVRDANYDPLSFALDNGLIVLDQAIHSEPVKLSSLKAIYRDATR